MAKLHWIVKRSEDELLLAATVKRKGKIYHCSPVETLQGPEKLAGTVDLTLESSKAAVLVDEFPEVKDDILELQIQNKLDQLALFNIGESVSISSSVLELRRQKQLLSIVAQPEVLTLDGIQTVASGGNVHLESCVSAVAAIASLMKQLGPDPFIVLLITRLSALLIGVRDGVPLFLQSIPLSGPSEVDSGVAAHAIGFGRQTMQRDFEIDTCRLVCLGEGRDSFDFEALEEENWIPDWNHCLLAEGNDIVLHPALFGSLFVASRFSFLPPEYSLAGRLKKGASILTIIAGIGCVVLSGLAYLNFQKNEPLQRQLDNEKKQLSREAGSVRQSMPEAGTVARVKSYMDIMDQVTGEPSVAILLQDIAHVLPGNVNFVDLKIKRESSGSISDQTAMGIPGTGLNPLEEDSSDVVEKSPAEQLLAQQIVVSLNCNSKGDYSRVKARFDETVEGLSSLFSLRNVDWDYSEAHEMGSFRCELLFAGERR